MYCILQYIDYLNYKRYRDQSLTTLKSLYSTDVDPNNSTLYFNPNCILQLILDYICTEAHINVDGSNYDLCNDAGELLTIKKYKANISGLTIFQQRKTYFIVVIKRDETTFVINEITPMLNPHTEEYLSLVKNITAKNFGKKKSSLSKMRRGSSSRQSLARSQSSNTSSRRRLSANM